MYAEYLYHGTKVVGYRYCNTCHRQLLYAVARADLGAAARSGSHHEAAAVCPDHTASIRPCVGPELLGCGRTLAPDTCARRSPANCDSLVISCRAHRCLWASCGIRRCILAARRRFCLRRSVHGCHNRGAYVGVHHRSSKRRPLQDQLQSGCEAHGGSARRCTYARPCLPDARRSPA